MDDLKRFILPDRKKASILLGLLCVAAIAWILFVINHFKDRRASIKKSFIRQRWHKNKSTDKFLTNTFKKRTTDKLLESQRVLERGCTDWRKKHLCTWQNTSEK